MNLSKKLKKEIHLPRILIYFLFAILLFLVHDLGRGYQAGILNKRIEKINKERNQFKNRVKELTKEMEDLKKSQKESTPSQKAETPEPVIETPTEITPSFPEEWVTFKSGILNIGFGYPVIWGEVTETVRDAKPNEVWLSDAKSGKVYSLSFSNKTKEESPLFHMGVGAYAQGFSQEFKPGCGGECCQIYYGDLNKPAGIEVSFNNFSLAEACCHRIVGTTCQPRDHLTGSIYFNLPNNQINGVQLAIPTLSDEDKQKVRDIVKEKDVCVIDNRFEVCSERFPNASKIQIEVEKMLKSGDGLDKESQINIQIFNKIANSAKIY